MQNCKCLPGLKLVDVPLAPNSTALPTKRCVPVYTPPIAVIVMTIVAGCFGIAVIITLAAWWIIQHRHALGPPGEHPPSLQCQLSAGSVAMMQGRYACACGLAGLLDPG